MRSIDLSVIIVTFHSEDTIVSCLDSLVRTVKKHSYEIIISDNSKDLSTEEALNVFNDKNKLIYIKNMSNLGFSKANNVGVQKSRGKYILFLNPDTIVEEGTIDGMVEFVKRKKDCGAATCYVRLPNGKLDEASHRGFPTPMNSLFHFSGMSNLFQRSKIFNGYTMSYLDMKKTHTIDSLAGSFMLVPYDIGEKVGWWDEDYFFYGEDIDFCYRLKKVGYQIYFVPEYNALHLKGMSSGIKKNSKNISKASVDTRRLASYHRFKAMEIFYNKHYKDKYPQFVKYLVILGIRAKRIIS